MNRCLLALVAAGAFTLSANAAHPVVPVFERFHSDKKDGDARGGRLLLTELGCVNCHAAADKTLLQRRAPVLTDVGSRARVGHLRKFISAPHATKPGTPMPDVLAGDPGRKEKAEALVHLLASTGKIDNGPGRSAFDGKKVYSEYGCVACHGTRDDKGMPDKVLPSSVPLGDLKEKYTAGSLAKFLEDPLHARPSGRMPKLLNRNEASAVAGYLLGVQGGLGTTRYSYYEGAWNNLPDFSKFKAAREGISAGFDISVKRRKENYALVFEGYFLLPKEGRYNFRTTSDDASKLFIDGKLVVNNDGVHAPTTRTGSAQLTKGVHKVRVEFAQVGGGDELAVFMNNKPMRDAVAASESALVPPKTGPGADQDAIKIDPVLVKKGVEVFASAGCASCHELKHNGKLIESVLKSPPLAKLVGGKGCLADSPGKGVPHYGLSEAQKKSLALAVKGPPAVKSAQEVVADTMSTFNCYACHAQNKVGGPPEELNKFFLTVQPEMGDEGRLPPPLDGAGAKLRPDYFKDLLQNGAHHRPYMYTRMPGFGGAVPGGLLTALKGMDKMPAVPEVKFRDKPSQVKSSARHLVGSKALGCIKCHTFKGQKAEGVQGIDMLMMPKRLKREWFHAYINDPQKVRPGTRMPSAFLMGKSVLPDILDGTANQQIEAMWVYLSDGNKAKLPVGVGDKNNKSIPLVPDSSAIIYRNFIEGAGPRAIAVGYPERLHLAFDANGLALAMMWQGEFIDAGRHWNDRGVGYQPPAGDNILRMHAGAPFEKLSGADAAWPTKAARELGWRFKGYKLTRDDRPTFLYSREGLSITDFPNPVERGRETVMTRKFTVTGAGEGPLTYRAAVANKIEALPGGVFQADGCKIKLPGARARKSGGKSELLFDVPLKDGKGTFVVEYNW